MRGKIRKRRLGRGPGATPVPRLRRVQPLQALQWSGTDLGGVNFDPALCTHVKLGSKLEPLFGYYIFSIKATTQKNEKLDFSEKYSPSNQLKIPITFAIRIPLRGDLAGSTQLSELHRETYF